MQSDRSNAPRVALEYLAIQALKPNPDRTRKSTPRQITSLVKSINRFGFVAPILVDSELNIIAGHARLEAAEQLGVTSVPVIVIRHLDAGDLQALSIGLNRIQELGTWDQSQLRKSIQSILKSDVDFDFPAIGFNTPEIDVVLDTTLPEATEDLSPSIVAGQVPVAQTGDLWRLGEHKLICGDALQQESYDAVLEGKLAQAVITDPPDNVKIDGHVRTAGSAHREFAMASGEMSPEAFTAFLVKTLCYLVSASIDGSLLYIFMDWRHLGELLAAGKIAYSELKNLVVWNKTAGGMGSLYRSQHELVLVFKSGKAPHINNVKLGVHGRYRTNVWDYPGVNIGPHRTELLALHPTVKPAALIADAIRDCTKVGDLVLDPFAGSGTILIAAEQTKRRAAAIEIDPLYVDAAIRRWQTHTGKTAVHCTTGHTFAEREAAAGPADTTNIARQGNQTTEAGA